MYFVNYAEGRHAVALLLAGWGRELAADMRLVDYAHLLHKPRIPLASYVFTGLEFLTEAELEQTARVWQGLREASNEVVLWNHPLRVRRRYSLLRTLHEHGINPFDAYRPDECRTPHRFPVFLRRADDHKGPGSDLIGTPEELDAALDELRAGGTCLNDWIITEFADTRDADGLYRKYGAFLVNGRIIPRHLLLSREWVVKGSNREIAARGLDEEWAWVNENPHADRLRRVFDLAHIDYGRIDYALCNGQLCVFEINTNPQILTPGESRDSKRQRVKALFARRLVSALREVAKRPHHRASVRIAHPRRPLLKRRPQFTELGIRISNSLGLRRFEPWIYRQLLRIRKLWH